jgi:uncharacterized protein (DUF427 family)
MSSPITTQPAGVRVQVKFKGKLLADSRDAVLLKESGYPPVYYLPRKDVKMELLQRSAHRTHCPYKGDASYFSVIGGPSNAAWTYEQPKDGVTQIREHLAFYPDKVEIAPT